jgi:N-acyl homoserine lactone hydrolase
MITSLLVALVATTDPTIKLYAIDCGHGTFADFGAFSDTGDYDGQGRSLAVPCFLIRHPKGDMLWEAGLGDGMHDKGADLGWVRLTVPATLQSQLRQLGMTYDDIDVFAFSHAHLDHIGNAASLLKATWLVPPAELAWVRATPGEHPELLTNVDRVKHIDVRGDYDVFGDGSVRLLRTPGHTPEHHVLLVRLPKTGWVILSGDLVHQRESYDKAWVPTFNVSRAETLASIERVKRLQAKLSARLIVEHDNADFEALPKFPKPLE